MARQPISNEQRKREVTEALRGMLRAAEAADPNDPAAWLPVAERAGKTQRRARLLAGLGRGG